MRLLVSNTDADWYRHLSGLAARPGGLDEANFWKPSGRQGFAALSFGEPLVFKLKKAHGHAVVGFGLFAAFRRLTIREAWNAFGEANGASSLADVEARVGKYVRLRAGETLPSTHRIGCVLLAAPVFFPPAMWVNGPADWSDNTVAGAGYDSTQGEGRRIWRECLDRAATLGQALDLSPQVTRDPTAHPTLFATGTEARYGAERTVRPRLGQGTFRYALEQAYGRCAVTGEHSLPALDAAHILPYGDGGEHTVNNGLLLRADVHRLFDTGYVTVTRDYEFRVSRRLREDYDNGRVYYEHDGRTIWTPSGPYPKPDPARLDNHARTVFLDA